MKDPNSPISNSDRALVVGFSIFVGAVVAFFVFWFALAIGLAVSEGEPVFAVFMSVVISIITFIIVPFAYRVLGRTCAQQIDRTREKTYKGTIEPLTKSQVVMHSTVSPLTIGPRHMWYFGIQHFDEQWSEKQIHSAGASARSATQTPRA